MNMATLKIKINVNGVNCSRWRRRRLRRGARRGTASRTWRSTRTPSNSSRGPFRFVCIIDSIDWVFGEKDMSDLISAPEKCTMLWLQTPNDYSLKANHHIYLIIGHGLLLWCWTHNHLHSGILYLGLGFSSSTNREMISVRVSMLVHNLAVRWDVGCINPKIERVKRWDSRNLKSIFILNW